MLIFLAESDQDLRLGFQMLLHQERGVHVIGMAVQGNGLLAQLEASQADVLFLNWRLPSASIENLLSEIRGLDTTPKIVVLSVNPEDKALALSAGADAFISMNAPPDELLEVVRSLEKSD
jgi:two-component system invasion response regulator UvrY